jgi:hypothetical protein
MVFGDKAEIGTMDLKRMDWMAAHPPAPVQAAPPPARPRD